MANLFFLFLYGKGVGRRAVDFQVFQVLVFRGFITSAAEAWGAEEGEHKVPPLPHPPTPHTHTHRALADALAGSIRLDPSVLVDGSDRTRVCGGVGGGSTSSE